MADVVLMGTPSFAVPALRALAAHHRVVGVVTQPDRRAGRGRRLVYSPVKEAALELGLPLFQPPTLRTAEAVRRLAAWQPEVIVVAAFGQILRPPVLELPPFGCLNIHASLLPRYRGASPVAAAILAGEPFTRVSLMLMDEGMDTGPILAQRTCSIAPEDTTGTLTGRLAEMGAQLLIETLPGWLAGAVQAQPQDANRATYCRLLRKEDGHLDWERSAAYLERQIRACDPWPGAYTTWRGRRLKVLHARLWDGPLPGDTPGRVVDLSPGLGVLTGQGVLELLEVQLAGKKPLPADTFVRGQKELIGSILGS